MCSGMGMALVFIYLCISSLVAGLGGGFLFLAGVGSEESRRLGIPPSPLILCSFISSFLLSFGPAFRRPSSGQCFFNFSLLRWPHLIPLQSNPTYGRTGPFIFLPASSLRPASRPHLVLSSSLLPPFFSLFIFIYFSLPCSFSSSRAPLALHPTQS
ncbi:hypothetical protein B0H11DRAFT_313486 [Mycena galericulata]|nr:hypothetical protein B0H11DRAFT_313486 [Mycena galericulata]